MPKSSEKLMSCQRAEKLFDYCLVPEIYFYFLNQFTHFGRDLEWWSQVSLAMLRMGFVM